MNKADAWAKCRGAKDENPGSISGLGAGAGVSCRPKFNSFKDVILYIPEGMFTVLFRPLLGEVNNAFGLVAGLEDIFLLTLFGLALARVRWREMYDIVCIWAVLAILSWQSFTHLSDLSRHICRYRVQILPLFLGLLIYMFGSKRIARR